MHKLPFAVLAITLVFALTTCKNPWINELLKSPSELSSLEVVAFAGETRLQGGAAFEPPFSAAVRDYLVYVPLETSRFTVNAGYDGNGTITWTTDGMDGAVSSNSFTFNFHDIEDTRVLTLVVERENMDRGEYRLAVTRTDNIPPPEDIAIHVTPSIGVYFLGDGMLPTVSVTVTPPTDGGTLKYQWFRNEDENNVTGSMLHGQTGTSYTLEKWETEMEGSTYYYVEITKTLDGKTVTVASLPRSVTFLNRDVVLTVKSGGSEHYWVNVPEGTVDTGKVWSSSTAGVNLPWHTDGYWMGRYPVTYELWEFVRDYAEAAGFRFAHTGNQGAHDSSASESTQLDQRPYGTPLHPVTMLSWRDLLVWCNAYSEMWRLDPVYLDSAGNVLRSSRENVEVLLDESKMAGKNGIRLPATAAELEYAARGADPNNAVWNYGYVGTNSSVREEIGRYVWWSTNVPCTDEVGGFNGTISFANGGTWQNKERLPNIIGLYDMTGLVRQRCFTLGQAFSRGFSGYPESKPIEVVQGGDTYDMVSMFEGFRLVRNR